MIRLEKVHKYFSRGTAAEVHALNGVSLELQKGEFTVVLGANGSGKSTMLQVLSGALLPDGGKVFINGDEVSAKAEHERSRWVSRVFQNPVSGTCSSLTILENFRMASLRTNYKGMKLGIGNAFRKSTGERIATLGLGLESKLDQKMGNLSGGQRQALTLLMAVMDESKLLLMDEPTAALDPRTAETIMQLANRVIRENGLTTILVTHSLRDALAYGDRLLLMQEGRIAKDIDTQKKKALSLAEVSSWY